MQLCGGRTAAVPPASAAVYSDSTVGCLFTLLQTSATFLLPVVLVPVAVLVL
jgi:hypothetical protein